MFVIALYIYLVATTGMAFAPWIAFLAFLGDVLAWEAIQNCFEAWSTGTTSDQVFWKERDDGKQ